MTDTNNENQEQDTQIENQEVNERPKVMPVRVESNDDKVEQLKTFYENAIKAEKDRLTSVKSEALAYKLQRNEILESDAGNRKKIIQLESELADLQDVSHKNKTDLEHRLEKMENDLNLARDSHAKSQAMRVKSDEKSRELTKELVETAESFHDFVKAVYHYVDNLKFLELENNCKNKEDYDDLILNSDDTHLTCNVLLHIAENFCKKEADSNTVNDIEDIFSDILKKQYSYKLKERAEPNYDLPEGAILLSEENGESKRHPKPEDFI